jgi:hypothetical protein
MDELKPCPFCDCTQLRVSQRDGVPLIACEECWGENWTIKAWNRREEVTALEAEIERLKEAAKTAQADGAAALVASFENVDPRARVCELEAEVARLKEETKRLPEFTWKAERYREVCDVLKRPQGEDVVGMVESIKKEWLELRAEKASGTTISIEQAREASQLASQAAAVHTVRACAQWLRINGWHNSVRDTAIEMERLMVEYVNQTYETPIIPEAALPEKHYATAAAQERAAIVKWIEKQIERYSENTMDTMRNEKECALARNALRMVAAQIRSGEHHDG